MVTLTGEDGTLYERGRSLAAQTHYIDGNASIEQPDRARFDLWLRSLHDGRRRWERARATVAGDQSEFGLRSDAFLTRS